MLTIIIISIAAFVLLVEFADQKVAIRGGKLLVDKGRLKITTPTNCPNCCPKDAGICPVDCSGCAAFAVTITPVVGSCCCTFPLNGVSSVALTRTGCTWTVIVFTAGFSVIEINVTCDTTPDPAQWEVEVLILSPPSGVGCPSCIFLSPIDRWVGTIAAKDCPAGGPTGVYSCITDGLGPNCTAVSPITVTIA